MTEKKAPSSGTEAKQADNALQPAMPPAVFPPRDHLGSSDAFSQTENTASADADNISDEKLDDLLDED